VEAWARGGGLFALGVKEEREAEPRAVFCLAAGKRGRRRYPSFCIFEYFAISKFQSSFVRLVVAPILTENPVFAFKLPYIP
jgi:hypothetical protein